MAKSRDCLTSEQIDTEAFLIAAEINPDPETIKLADDMIGIASYNQQSGDTLGDIGRLFVAASSGASKLTDRALASGRMDGAGRAISLYRLAQRILDAKTRYHKRMLLHGPWSIIPYSGIVQEEVE